MVDIVYNGLHPLNLAKNKSSRIRIRGEVKNLSSIPTHYKDQNPDLFVETDIQTNTAESYCQKMSESGNVLKNLNRFKCQFSFFSVLFFMKTKTDLQ